LTVILAVNADKHSGSRLGLCPPYFEFTDGGMYRANKGQLWAWERWLGYWDYVAALKESLLAVDPSTEVWSIDNGDAQERGKHASHQYITSNKTDVERLAVRVNEPTAPVVDKYWFSRGTGAHDGKSGWMAEWLAEDLGGERPDDKAWSWWYIPMEIEGILIDFYHRPPTSGRMPWTENAAASRASAIIRTRCVEIGDPVPDLCVFSHFHYYADSGRAKYPRVLYTPSWALPSDWIHDIGKGVYPPRIGGLIFVITEGTYKLDDSQLFRPKRTPRWSLQSRN